MKATNKLPEKLRNAKPSNWLDQIEWERENEAWLDLSFEIAIKVYAQLKKTGQSQRWLAEQLDVTPQYVSKLLKGKQNLTLQQITKLEAVLAIKLVEVPSEVTISFEIEAVFPVNLVRTSREHMPDLETFTDAISEDHLFEAA